jgi:hypothetical protein
MGQVLTNWGEIWDTPEPATPEEAERQRKELQQFRERLRRGKTITMQEAQERELARREKR